MWMWHVPIAEVDERLTFEKLRGAILHRDEKALERIIREIEENYEVGGKTEELVENAKAELDILKHARGEFVIKCPIIGH